MNFIKNVSISILYIVLCLLILTFILTLFSYFNIISDKVVSIFKIIIPIISLFIGGFFIGKKSLRKGWLEGLKLSLIFLVVLVIFEYLALDQSFDIKNILYYLILSISSIFGSMIGISKKKIEN